MRIISTSVLETRATGAKIAGITKESSIYGLIGDLGCGKTEFVRGFVAALREDIVVSSPSFSILNTYNTNSHIVHHFDFYRLKNYNELMEIGFYEYSNSNAVLLIEWADRLSECMPSSAHYIRFYDNGTHERIIEFDF